MEESGKTKQAKWKPERMKTPKKKNRHLPNFDVVKLIKQEIRSY